jgi:hypothetical protein
MKFFAVILTLFILSTIRVSSQENTISYRISKENPYGKYNPKAANEIQDYKDLIGLCKCTSETRNPDGSWQKSIKLTWKWKYVKNGTALQDETLKEDGKISGNIREYDTIAKQWNVNYYTSEKIPPQLTVWKSNKTTEGKIVLYTNQNDPNGVEGFSKVTFYDISDKGYKSIGEWTDLTEKTVYPIWKITCLR